MEGLKIDELPKKFSNQAYIFIGYDGRSSGRIRRGKSWGSDVYAGDVSVGLGYLIGEASILWLYVEFKGGVGLRKGKSSR